MSVEPSPPSITSAPAEVTPRAKAAASGPDEVRMSCTITIASAPVSLANAAPTASADPFVQLIRDDAPDVV